MGRSRQSRPKKLAMKLRAIRASLGLNKREMTDKLRKLAPKEKIGTGHVFQYEEGTRLPSYLVLLAYARSVNISTDYLIDDTLELSKGNVNPATSDLLEEKRLSS